MKELKKERDDKLKAAQKEARALSQDFLNPLFSALL